MICDVGLLAINYLASHIVIMSMLQAAYWGLLLSIYQSYLKQLMTNYDSERVYHVLVLDSLPKVKIPKFSCFFKMKLSFFKML